MASLHKHTSVTTDLENEQRAREMLESELHLTLAAMRKAEEAHAEELVKLQAQNAKSVQEARAMMEKLQTIQQTEDALRDFYVQLKDRCAPLRAPATLLSGQALLG